MARAKQNDFFSDDPKMKREYGPGKDRHGGGLGKGKRKIMRPLDPRKPVHITMKSSKAKGKLSLMSKRLEIARIVEDAALRNRVTLHRLANVFNHLHMTASFKRRGDFQKFLRVVAGLIARIVTGARRGKPFGKFWDEPVFTRVLTGKRSFEFCQSYVEANQVEAAEGRSARDEFLRKRRTRQK